MADRREHPATTKQPAEGYEVGPMPGERVYAFPGAGFPTNPNKRAR